MSSSRNKSSRQRIQWSKLPTELLSKIAQRLETCTEIFNFKLTCKTWRNAVPFTLIASRNILSPIFPYKLSTKMPLTLSAPEYCLEYTSFLFAGCVFQFNSLVDPHQPPWLAAVLEFNNRKLSLLRALSQRRVKIPGAYINWTRLRVVEVSRFYTLCQVCREQGETRARIQFVRVVFMEGTPSYDDRDKLNCKWLMLEEDGDLGRVKCRDGNVVGIHRVGCSVTKKFDDFVKIKEKVYVIDRKGRLYCMIGNRNHDDDRVLMEMVVKEGVGTGIERDRKKRLVEAFGEMYLVHRRCEEGVFFKVFRLDRKEMKWEELVAGIGDDRVLFVTCDCSFFLPVASLPGLRGNCLVFTRGSFPGYTSDHLPDAEIFVSKLPVGQELELAVFDFGSGECRPIKSYPGYSSVIWPPPAWLSWRPPLSRRCPEKDETAARNCLSRVCADSGSLDTSSSSTGCQVDRQTEDHSSPTHTQKLSSHGTSTQIQGELVTGDASPTTTEYHNAYPETPAGGGSKVKFQGVDVCLDLLPTLKKIWAKYGNILEGHVIRSNDLMGWALESVAKVVILLQSSSGKSLNDEQADYLSSTVVDLQMMRLNITWLTPYSEEALRFHKVSTSRAKLVEKMAEIEQVTSQVEDMKTKLLAEIDGVEQILAEQRKTVSRSLSALESIDNNNARLLVEGLC